MNHLHWRFVGIVLAASVATSTNLVAAQTNAAREAAIRKCMAQALKEYPRKGGDDGNDSARTAVYKSCMTNGGFAP